MKDLHLQNFFLRHNVQSEILHISPEACQELKTLEERPLQNYALI